MIKSSSKAKRVRLYGLYLPRYLRRKPNATTGPKAGEVLNACQEFIGKVALQNEPIGKHDPHQALDVITLNDSATPAVAYTTVVMIARVLFGRYPVGFSAGCR